MNTTHYLPQPVFANILSYLDVRPLSALEFFFVFCAQGGYELPHYFLRILLFEPKR